MQKNQLTGLTVTTPLLLSLQKTIDFFSEPAPKEETPEPALPAAAVTKSSYVPPHLRNVSNASANPVGGGGGVGPTLGGPRGPRRPKHAPDINNEVYFPSLSAAMGTDDPAYKTGQTNR